MDVSEFTKPKGKSGAGGGGGGGGGGGDGHGMRVEGFSVKSDTSTGFDAASAVWSWDARRGGTQVVLPDPIALAAARRGGAAGEGDRYDGAVWCVDLYDDHFDSSSAVDEGGDLRRKHHIGRGWLRVSDALDTITASTGPLQMLVYDAEWDPKRILGGGKRGGPTPRYELVVIPRAIPFGAAGMGLLPAQARPSTLAGAGASGGGGGAGTANVGAGAANAGAGTGGNGRPNFALVSAADAEEGERMMEQLSRCKRTFYKLDRDGSGSVDRDELGAALNKSAELRQLLCSAAPPRTEDAAAPKRGRKGSKAIRKRGAGRRQSKKPKDGSKGKDATSPSASASSSPVSVGELFALIDRDDSGSISWDEFVSFATSAAQNALHSTTAQSLEVQQRSDMAAALRAVGIVAPDSNAKEKEEDDGEEEDGGFDGDVMSAIAAARSGGGDESMPSGDAPPTRGRSAGRSAGRGASRSASRGANRASNSRSPSSSSRPPLVDAAMVDAEAEDAVGGSRSPREPQLHATASAVASRLDESERYTFQVEVKRVELLLATERDRMEKRESEWQQERARFAKELDDRVAALEVERAKTEAAALEVKRKELLEQHLTERLQKAETEAELYRRQQEAGMVGERYAMEALTKEQDALVRGVEAKKQEQGQQAAAAMKLQSRMRSVTARREVAQRRAVVAEQRAVEDTAAARIQGKLRGNTERKRYEASKSAALRIQAAARGKQARNVAEDRMDATEMLQTFWRGNKARGEFLAMKEAATAVQTASRSLLAKRKVGEMKQEITEQNGAARAMQSSWRQRQARGELVTRKEDRETKVRGQADGWGKGLWVKWVMWVMWVMWGRGSSYILLVDTHCLLLSTSLTRNTHTHTHTHTRITLLAPPPSHTHRSRRVRPCRCRHRGADARLGMSWPSGKKITSKRRTRRRPCRHRGGQSRPRFRSIPYGRRERRPRRKQQQQRQKLWQRQTQRHQQQ